MSSDFFKKLQPLFEAKDSDLEKAVCKAEDKKKAKKEEAAVKALDKKPANVKENAADFFRKYSNIVTEAEDACDGKDWYIDTTDGDRKAGPFNSEKEAHDHLYNLQKKTSREETSSMKVVCESYSDDDDEDDDVKKADAVKGKDGKKQADFEKGKKWNFDKADKKGEDKGVAKAKKDKDLTESYDDDDEDPDVKKAMSVKGKDGKKQADVEKDKKWSFDKKLDKADKNAEDKGAKKAAKDKDLTEATRLSGRNEYSGSNDPYGDNHTRPAKNAADPVATSKRNEIASDAKMIRQAGGSKALNKPAGKGRNACGGGEVYTSKAIGESYDDDDEDDDVKKADAVKGKDGKKQADFEKGKKFDFSKLDKKGEDKGAKKAAKDKDLTESVVNQKVSRHSLEVDGVNQDDPEDGQAYFSYGECMDGTPLSQEQLAQLTSKYRDIADMKAFASVRGGDWDQDAWGDDIELEEDSGPSDEVTADDIEELFNGEYESNVLVAYAAFVRSSPKGQVYFFVSQDDETGEYLVNSITIADDSGALRMVDHGAMPEGEFGDLEEAINFVDTAADESATVTESKRVWIKNK